MEPKMTGRRIVSKSEYLRTRVKIQVVALSGFCSLLLGGFCLLVVSGFLIALIFDKNAFLESGWFLLLLPVCGVGIIPFCKFGVAAIDRAEATNPGVPLTRFNTGELPAPESLVRASAEPRQAQEAVLLRAATETQEQHEEQLLRASGRQE